MSATEEGRGGNRVRIGVDLGGTKIEALAIDAAGQELLRRRVPTPQGNYHGTVNAVADLIRSIEGEIGGQALIGVGSPGTLSRRTGKMINCNSTALNGKPLPDDLQAVLGRSIRLENDANCFALSEAVDGAGAGHGLVFGAILGTGVGAGVIMDGRLRPGRHYIAGEWGHNPMPWATAEEMPLPACWCGRLGCIEMFLKGEALSRIHFEESGQKADGATIGAAASRGDLGASRSLHVYRWRLARALAHVVNILDPDVIVLGGGLSNLAGLYRGLREMLREFTFSDTITTPILPALHGDSSGVRGAAWLNDA